MRRFMKWFGLVVAAGLVMLGVLYLIVDEPRPTGRQGPEADALVSRLERAVHLDAWERTGAVRWIFAGKRRHLWDRQRRLARVRWDEVEVLLRLDDRSGIARRAGRRLDGADRREVVEEAYAGWVNDSFWLNPIAHFRGESIERALVSLDDGGRGLLVSYTSGGLTPGDAYLWLPGEEGRPRGWRMWVSILPVGGLEASWEGWQRLETGALISTRHVGPLGITLELSDVAGAEDLEALLDGEPDPFEPLVSDGAATPDG